MESADINGVLLEYEVTGSGEPILLISTGPIADSFLPFFSEKALVESHRLIRYRQRLLDRSAERPVSFAEHAADAVALLAHLGIRRAHIAGHSTGAAIALQLAVDHPDVVHTLALLEPTLPAAPNSAAFFDKAGPTLAAYASGDREAAMVAFLSLACSLDWQRCRAAIEQHVPGGVALAIANADNWFGSYVPALGIWQFGADQAALIPQPVLSVVGTDTDPWFAASHEMLRSWFPQAEVCTVEGVAHLLHMQRPRPVAQGVADFVARHPMTESDSMAVRMVHQNEVRGS